MVQSFAAPCWLKVSLLLSVYLLAACATPAPRVSRAPESLFSGQATDQETGDMSWRLSEQSLKAIREIEEEIIQADTEISDSSKEAPKESFDSSRPRRIPIEINENVRKWIHFFAFQDRSRFHRFLRRGNAYKTLIQGILRKNQVPTDLYYLAMIESGYDTHARSRARAVGVWQFIQGTGTRYGLVQNHYVDERRDVIRSTEAAAKYLRNLHTAFQSWYLAMAGYNAGEGRILGAIMRGGSRDFWELVEKKALPPETRNYVPKFLAALIIGKHPDKYGFNDIDAESFPELEPAEVPGGVELSHLANKSKVDLATLKSLNPHLLRSVTPANVKTYTLWVPKDTADTVSKIARSLPRAETARYLASDYGVHVVRRGENLGIIARRYRMSIPQLKRLNGLRSSAIHAGRKLRVWRSARSAALVHHHVRRGDALIPLAQRN